MEGSKEKLITFGYLTFDYLWITLVNFGYLSLALAFGCLSLPFLTFPYLSLPFLTFPYLSLPFLIFPYLSLPFVTFPYISLPFPTCKYYSTACGIEVPNSDQLVITGGHAGGSDGLSRVQVYTVGGAKERLAELNQPRKQHTCGYFFNGNNLVITH